jgi:drug/metabolite transporter (DMT)-like permease
MHWPSVLLYMTSSFMIVIFNKVILTQYQFPSVPFLMLCQSIFSSVFFWTKLKQKANRELILVCLLNVGNVFFGLNAAGTLNIAMFTALRRISVMMTLIAQWWFLGKKSSKPVVITVAVMVFGSFVAASDDLTFDLFGYTFAMMNNFLTAAAQIASKYAFDKGWEKETILFYSSLTSVVLSGIKCYDFELTTFHAWNQTGFQIAFVFSIALGIMLNFGASWVIEKNDALTLAVSGSTKSAVMGLLVCFGLFDPTYVFTWVNFTGLQISTIGSFVYVYYTKVKPKYTPVSMEVSTEEKKQMTSV